MITRLHRYRLLALSLLGALLLLAPVARLTAAPPEPDDGALPGDALPDTVRFDAAPGGATQAAAPQLGPPAAPIPLPDPVWRVGVLTDGLHALDYAALAAAGVPVTDATPADFHLLWRGQPVALDEIGTGDGSFDPGDALVFYGEKFHGTPQDEKYTDENVYWLAVDAAAPGLRVASRDVTPGGVASPAPGCTDTLTIEENWEYWARHSDNPGTVATWFWDRIPHTDGSPAVYTMALAAPLPDAPATLVVEVAARAGGDHSLRPTLNGTALGERTWAGEKGFVATFPVPAGALGDGANPLELETDELARTLYFDRAALTYRRAPQAVEGTVACQVPVAGSVAYTFTALPAEARLYDVSDPLRPVRLDGPAITGGALAFADAPGAGARLLAESPRAAALARYSPPADLLDPPTGADEIVLAPRHYLDALAPLVAQRRAQGLRVRVVAVEDVYPLFNGGVFHPEAIRAFVAHARAQWPGPPARYLFLVGDGNFNLKGYDPEDFGDFVPSLIPPYMEFADPVQGEVPVDARFGDADGDGLPELAVGHIPAQTVTEVEAYVAKLLAYEAQPPSDWQLHNLLVADNGQNSDEGFDSLLNRLAEELPTAMTTQTVYMEDYCTGYSPCPSATQATFDGWNAGAGLLIYAGHASIHRWAHEPLFFNTDLTALTQTQALPFVLSLNCWDGYWMFPPQYPGLPGRDVRSVGEWATTVLTETGAVATFGPAGLAFAFQEEILARAMLQAAVQEGTFDLGTLTQVGREAIRTSYMARTYTLLGDPALTLPWWQSLTLALTRTEVTVGSALDLAALFAPQGATRFGQHFDVTPAWTADGAPLGWSAVYTAPVAPATVQLAAHLGPVSASVTLDVVAGPPVTVTVAPDPLRIAPSETAQMAATLRDALGNPLPLTTTVAWSSTLGTIDAGGIFTAPPHASRGRITATVPVSQGTNTLWLSGAALVEVYAGQALYLPLTMRGYGTGD